MIKVMFDGHYLEVADDASAKLVTDAMTDMTKQVTDAQGEQQKAEATRDAMKEQLDAEKLKTSDAAINERLTAVATVTTQARKIVGDTFTCDSVSTMDIQRAALTAKRPGTAWSDKADVYVQAAFDMAFDSISTVSARCSRR